MCKPISFFKKFALISIVVALGLVAIPASGAFAAGLQDPTNPPATPQISTLRLELTWARAQKAYQHQGYLISLADGFVTKVQVLIDWAKGKGLNISAVQAALDAFESVIPAAQAAHLPGASIIASHNGFSADGKVIDRPLAIETTQSLLQILKDTRTAMNGTGRALWEAIRDFRTTYHPSQNSVTP